MNYQCKYCGTKASNIASLMASPCFRHPAGANKGEHALYEGGEKSKYECRHYRQGDVLIERVADIPLTAEKQGQSTSIILAHGETTGHDHALETADAADWWKMPTRLSGELLVSLPSGGVVTHQEHSEIKLRAGFYRITLQREYTPEVIRNVAD